MASAFITPETFRFLRALARNNNREWFAKNKERYHDEVRDPLCAFVEAIGPKLRTIEPNVIADSRPNGGSLFRIYRDTRFAKDKTAAGIHFRTGPRTESAPGFYLNVEPGNVFAGMGLWRPDSAALRGIREAIVDKPGDWKKARRIGLDGEPELKRIPRGFDADDPHIDDLRRKSFTTSIYFSDADACRKDFPTQFAAACRKAKPFMAFLSRAAA